MMNATTIQQQQGEKLVWITVRDLIRSDLLTIDAIMPNLPLHSMIESSWVVPRDENLESSLFILEEQEKEYNARLDSIAKVEAPEPIGKASSAGILNGGRIMPSPPNTRPRSVRSRHRQSNSGRSSYGYTPTSAGDSSRRSYYRREMANSQMSTPGGVMPSPINSSRAERQAVYSASFDDDTDIGMDQSTTIGGNSSH